MKTWTLPGLILILMLCSCVVETKENSMDQWKNEVLQTEADFARMSDEEGIAKAFAAYAADNAVLMRNNKLVKGKEELIRYLTKQPVKLKDEKLSWKPDFVDVSASGDLAYTYGQFSYSYTDSAGTKVENTGVFHTVWKRQEDGSWRFVWD